MSRDMGKRFWNWLACLTDISMPQSLYLTQSMASQFIPKEDSASYIFWLSFSFSTWRSQTPSIYKIKGVERNQYGHAIIFLYKYQTDFILVRYRFFWARRVIRVHKCLPLHALLVKDHQVYDLTDLFDYDFPVQLREFQRRGTNIHLLE